MNFIKTFFKEFYRLALLAMVVMWLFIVTFELNNPGFVICLGIVALIVSGIETSVETNNSATVKSEETKEEKEEAKEEK